jgi:hypothetical protein
MEAFMNTHNNDADRYEIYVGMFGDVHRIDKTTLSSRIVLPLINFGWFLICLYILVPVTLVLLVTLVCMGNYLFAGDAVAISGLIIGGMLGLFLSLSKKERK